MLNRIYQLSFNGRIEVVRAKRVMTWNYRMPHRDVANMLTELKDLGAIEFENHIWMQIKWTPEKLLGY